MSFSIRFLDEPDIPDLYEDPTTLAAPGEIQIGNFVEGFDSSLYLWTREQYVSQWREALKLLMQGSNRTALITEYTGNDSSTLWWWTIYAEGETAYFHQQLLLFDQLDRPFAIESLQDFISDRVTLNDEGQKISEWLIPMKDLRAFWRSL